MMQIFRSISLRNAAASANIAPFSGGTVNIYTGTMPVSGGAITDQILLVSIPIPDPSGTVFGGEFILDTPIEAMAVASGLAGWCRILDVTLNQLLDADAGEVGGGAAVVVFPSQIYAGGTVRLNEFKLIEP
jgi:hypothetical protein